MSASTAMEALEAFVRLAREARRRALPREERAQLLVLDEQLRDLLDGSRPAPRRIEGREAAEAPVTAHQVVQELELSPEAARKVNRVGLHEVRSTYTPSRKPAFLDAYFDEAVDEIPETSAAWAPRQVVDPEGAAVELPQSTQDLWGVGQAPPPPPPRGRVAARPAASPGAVHVGPAPDASPASGPRTAPAGAAPAVAPAGSASTPVSPFATAAAASPGAPAPAAAAGADPAGSVGSSPSASGASTPAESPTAGLPPAIVHLLEGGTRRGFIERFDAAAGRLWMVMKDRPDERCEVRLDQVLVIFFGRRPTEPASVSEGRRVEVTLVNDKRVSGASPDYQPNGSAITVVPESARGGVDRVWVPAWSVKSIAVND